MAARYELFDHTADIGVRVWAPSLPELVAPSMEALYAMIGLVTTTADAKPRTFVLTGEEPPVLLRDYLAELVHLFAVERRRLTDVAVHEFTDRRLAVGGQARLVDFAASRLEREVKAVTYHELAIRAIAGGYEATYIVDI